MKGSIKTISVIQLPLNVSPLSCITGWKSRELVQLYAISLLDGKMKHDDLPTKEGKWAKDNLHLDFNFLFFTSTRQHIVL